MKEFKKEIVRHIGVVSEASGGWRLELNMVSWNGMPPKIDLHDWAPDHSKCSNRGTFTREEVKTLINLLQREIETNGE